MGKTVTINQDKLLMLKEVVASNEFVSHIPFLYHATPSCYVDSIKEFGLGGKIPEKRFWSYKGTPYENIKYGVFLATDEYVAESYLEASEEFEELCETYEEDLEIVVFRINTNDLDLSLLSEDENQIQEGDESERTYFYNGTIPFEKLEKITLYENVIKEAAPEVDEYEIGDEGSNPPVGGNFYHVNESISFDSSEIGAVNYSWDFDEEEYQEENEKMNSQPTENYDIISLAVEEFGTTSRLSQAGYILPDGNLLNFGSGGYRETDHRQIAAVYKQNNISIWNDEYRYNYVVDFMNHGAIRCDVNSGILDMTKEPTKEQYYVLKNFVRIAADVDIDFTDDKGNTLHSVSYSDAKPQAVVADIMRYYEDGIKPMGNVQYEGKRNASLVENYDFEVNSSEIDLSSFKKKHELVPNIWNPDGKLNSRIRLKLLDIADDFWEYVNLTWVKPSGIILTGSICNFNWSQYSDIDLHLIVDFDEIDEKIEFVKDYLDSKKNEWNNEHSGLQIMGYPVELYVQNLGEIPESNGIYDLEENDWIREPNPDDIKSIGLNKFSIKEKAAKIMTIIDDMYDALASTDDSHKIEQMGDDASYLWKKVKEMRKSSLEKNGESGSGNIVYKILRREFYLDKLWRLKVMCYDKLNSIPYPIYRNESIKKYITLLKENLINEEIVADGNSEHNPYKKRWEAERKALKDFICNFGKVMTSKENGKTYKVYYDKTLSQLIGYNYCICLQWDAVNLKPKSVLYIRALDKFTDKMFQANFDARGRDNLYNTADDINYGYSYE